MNTQLAESTQATSSVALSMFANAELFELVQRQAKLISQSDLIPKQFQGNVPNCAIALEMASRLGASPFAVVQNLDVIHGRPSWRAVFLMGLVNNCGRFTPLQFKLEVTGAQRTVDLEIEAWTGPQGARKKSVSKRSYTYTPTRCVAWARDKSSGDVIEGPPVSYDMALEEGWVAKDGSKWLTEMRELMLRYRAASFFAKVYASDVMLGMQTSEEERDIGPAMRNVTPAGEAQDGPAPRTVSRNPYEDVAPAAEEPQAKAKRAPKAKAPAQEEAAPDVVPDAPADDEQPEPTFPPRLEMVAAIKEAFTAAEMTFARAGALYKKAGLIDPDGSLNALTDEQMFRVYQYRVEGLKEGFTLDGGEA
jgi:hypothetical protein